MKKVENATLTPDKVSRVVFLYGTNDELSKNVSNIFHDLWFLVDLLKRLYKTLVLNETI